MTTDRTTTDTIIAQMWELANDAQREWEATFGQMKARFVAEYNRGYMNAMHQAIGIVKEATSDD